MPAEWFWRLVVGLLLTGAAMMTGSWVSWRRTETDTIGRVAGTAGFWGLALMALAGAAAGLVAFVYVVMWVILGSAP